MNDEYSPLETLRLASRTWWIIALAMIAGGLLGILVFQLRQPVYEATTAFAMGIDYTRTGPITQYDEDHALGMAGTLIYSYRVQEEVAAIARENGISIDAGDLYRNSFIERKAHVWIVRVQNRDPETAAQIAEIWADVAIKRLEEAYRHALEKERLERYAASLVDCLQMSVATNPALSPCGMPNMQDVQAALTEVEARVFEEKQASYNIFPGLLFGEVTVSPVPSRPVRYGQGNLILAGLVGGFVVGLLLIHAPGRKRAR